MRTDSVTYRSAVWIGEQKSYRITLLIGVAFLAAIVILMCPFLIASDASAFGHFPSGTRIAGVNVGNMTKAEALAACRKDLATVSSQPVALKVDTESYSVTPSELSLAIDYQKMVDTAYDRTWNVNIVERLVRRLLGRPKTVEMPVIVSYDKARLADLVNRAMPSINCKPRSAYLDVTTGAVRLVQGREGREADPGQVLAAAVSSLDSGQRDVAVPVAKRTPAAEPTIQPQKVILVNQATHSLRLYNGEQLLAEYPVAIGSPQYPTVIGQWKIVKMEKNPTWYNRGSTWADNMPASIPPGPGNPLGTRAMTINGGGDLIHGTPDSSSVGYSVSHGCMRMRIPDVEALYEQCNVGMPVYIIKQAGQIAFDCTKHPFWWGHE